MGLAEPRKRIKISHDPNNLAWSRSNTSYGAKILVSHGWSPGQGLGARSAKQVSAYGAATPSNPRVTVKDDYLGLGAVSAGKLAEERSRQMDAFQGLLGRLNGKNEEELQREERKADDIYLAAYARNKWGGMQFVKGGVLVQGKDFMEGLSERDVKDRRMVEVTSDRSSSEQGNATHQNKPVNKKDKGSNKQDAAMLQLEKGQEPVKVPERLRKHRNEEKQKKKAAIGQQNVIEAASNGKTAPSTAKTQHGIEEQRPSKKSKSKKKEMVQSDHIIPHPAERPDKAAPTLPSDSVMPLSIVDRAKDPSKPGKKRKKIKAGEAESSEPPCLDTGSHKSDSIPTTQISDTAVSKTDLVTTASQPSASSTATATPFAPPPRLGRHALRGRNIESKRMAFLDVNGLDGIFMKQAK